MPVKGIRWMQSKTVIKHPSVYMMKATQNKEYIEQEIKRSGSRVCCLALSVEHMTSKPVNES